MKSVTSMGTTNYNMFFRTKNNLYNIQNFGVIETTVKGTSSYGTETTETNLQIMESAA